jgi:hypothetical protein
MVLKFAASPPEVQPAAGRSRLVVNRKEAVVMEPLS